MKISLREYSLITNRHNQKLINTLERQNIYGGFLKILIFRVSLSKTHWQNKTFFIYEMGSGKWNSKYQFLKKTSINLLVFQYVKQLLVMFIWNYFHFFFCMAPFPISSANSQKANGNVFWVEEISNYNFTRFWKFAVRIDLTRNFF